MPGAVAVIDTLTPDRRSGNCVQQRRQNALGKMSTRQRDHTLEDARTVLLLFGTRCSDRHHARDVGGTAKVLAARIDQQQPITFYPRMLRLGRAVMWHRAIGVEACNGGKARRDIARTPLACLRELFINGQFADRLSPQRTVQPGEELAKRCAVLLHCLTDVGRIGFGFLRLQ